MKIKLVKKYILLNFLIIYTVIMITTIFAWFAEADFIDLQTSGSSLLNYFARGIGSVEDPFILNHKRHVYHLAWLQNLGHFNGKKILF